MEDCPDPAPVLLRPTIRIRRANRDDKQREPREYTDNKCVQQIVGHSFHLIPETLTWLVLSPFWKLFLWHLRIPGSLTLFSSRVFALSRQ